MKLTDILSIEEWIELEKDLHEKSGLDSNVFNVEGLRITGLRQWVNRLCPVIKADDRGQSFICAVAHMNISGMAKQTKKTIIEECDAGMLKMVVPIFVKDEFLGAVGGCGVLLDDSRVDTFMINRTIHIDEEKIISLSEDIKKITAEEAAVIGQYITDRIGKIVSDFEKQ